MHLNQTAALAAGLVAVALAAALLWPEPRPPLRIRPAHERREPVSDTWGWLAVGVVLAAAFIYALWDASRDVSDSEEPQEEDHA